MVCEDSLCPRKQPDVSGSGLGEDVSGHGLAEAGRYRMAGGWLGKYSKLSKVLRSKKKEKKKNEKKGKKREE